MNVLMLLMPLTMLLAQPEPTVLIDQSFSLHESAEQAADSMGTYSIKASEQGDEIKITESVQLTTKRGVVDMTSIVVYKQDDEKAWRFHAATALTGVEGDTVMKVSVEPKDKQWSVAATYLRKPFGEAFDEPKVFKFDLDIPEGPVLFSSARAVMGPRLQAQAGEQSVVWVEFPDDVDEPINVKEGFTLVRDKADAEGDFMLWVRSEHQTLGPLPLGADGKIKPHQLWGKMLMREK